jgi:hypothetical protein
MLNLVSALVGWRDGTAREDELGIGCDLGCLLVAKEAVRAEVAVVGPVEILL